MAKSSGGNGDSGSKGQPGGKNWLAILRIYIGAYFLHSSLDKFTASYISEFSRLIGRWAHDSSFEWYKALLDQYVLPHAKFFAYFTAIGEFCIGIALILGFLSGLAAIFGVGVYANYYLGTSTGDALWNYATIILCLAVIFFTGAGRTLGLDKYLSKKIHFKYIV